VERLVVTLESRSERKRGVLDMQKDPEEVGEVQCSSTRGIGGGRDSGKKRRSMRPDSSLRQMVLHEVSANRRQPAHNRAGQ
jgi:hypothetical protein